MNCGVKNEDDIVTKNGTQTSRFTLPITGVSPTYLRLQKQRFVCKACNSSFTACFISENTKAQVVIKSAEAQPLISIAKDCSVSPTTVQRLEVNVVQEMLGYDPELKANYKLYQELLSAMSNRDFNALESILER